MIGTRVAHGIATALALLGSADALAKLPPPSDEAKAKAAQAAAKGAYDAKLASFQLCRSMDRVAASYFARAKTEGKDVRPAMPTAPCVDPGPYVAAPSPTAGTPGPSAAAPAATPARR